MSKTHKHIVEEAADYNNVADSLDYELRGSRGKTWAGRWINAHREWVIRATQKSILGGTLSSNDLSDVTLTNNTFINQTLGLLDCLAVFFP